MHRVLVASKSLKSGLTPIDMDDPKYRRSRARLEALESILEIRPKQDFPQTRLEIRQPDKVKCEIHFELALVVQDGRWEQKIYIYF